MFTPVHTILGGFLLHLSSSTLLSSLGRVLGGSTILSEAIFGDRAAWRFAVLFGMIVAPIVNHRLGVDELWAVHAAQAGEVVVRGEMTSLLVAVAGGFIGIGSKIAGGCTSGHFLCGFSRLSPRSITASLVLFSTAILTARLTALSPSSIPVPTLASTVVFIPPSPQNLVILPFTLYNFLSILSKRTRSFENVLLTSLLCGYTFSTGLQLSGMSNPNKTLRFLHIPIVFPWGEWDPSLLMVFIGGVIPNMIHYHVMIKPQFEAQLKPASAPAPPANRPRPPHFHLPTPAQAQNITKSLVIGSAIFGIGWGLTGECLLPGLVNFGSTLAVKGDLQLPSTFLGSIIAGIGLGKLFGF